MRVVDYKPRSFDDSLYQFFRKHKYKNLAEYFTNRRKERAIGKFRKKNLNLTRRVYSCGDIANVVQGCDMVIAGSDQVMNPSFLRNGEGAGVITPSYFLGFPYDGRRVSYAVSFGCVEYPQDEGEIAARYIGDFERISVRENTGVEIVGSMGRNDAVVVPDPTILLPQSYYKALAAEWNKPLKRPYVYSFFIRNEAERCEAVGKEVANKRLLWHGNVRDYSMQGWLGRIERAEGVITDSFHCLVMCLKLHKPFVVINEVDGNEGMNDRFYSILGRLGLTDRILHKSNIESLGALLTRPIDWTMVDEALEEFAAVGLNFLKQ